jgi:heme-degrading monooxygenase HmoA
VHLGEEPAYDVLIVPGGDTSAVEEDERVLDWVRRAARRADTTVSICTGAFVLARAGVLDHRPVTTHWMDIVGLRAAFPDLDVREDRRYIDHGDLATSAGISAGIDLSLHLVRRLAGAELASEVARRMEYRWDQDGTAVVVPAAGVRTGEPVEVPPAAKDAAIARVWSGIVRDEDGDAYAAYMRRTGVPGYTAIDGNLGVRMLRRRVEAGWEFAMFSLWESMDAIRAFAGPDPEVAVFYPEDDRFLIDRDLRVRHYQVHTSAGPEPRPADVGGIVT